MQLELTLAYSVLAISSSYLLFLYVRQLRRTSVEYTNAKRALDDIVVSFNADIKKQERRIEEITLETGEQPRIVARAIEETRCDLNAAKKDLIDLAISKVELLSNFEALRKSLDEVKGEQQSIYQKMSTLEVTHDRGIATKPLSTLRSLRVELEAVRQLTDTETRILELMFREGDQTAPQIKERIGLTREHTARLMKSLFLRGYVERTTDRLPYAYRLNKEMAELIRGESPRK